MPHIYDRNPTRVNIHHPIMIIKKPAKKKIDPCIFEDRVKNPTAFLSPTRATTPIKKEIYAVIYYVFLTFPRDSKARSRNKNTPIVYNNNPRTIRPIPISKSCKWLQKHTF
jgi:hypothetical protein